MNSVFLEDWEVGRVASSCRLSVDLLCQEMWDAWRETSLLCSGTRKDGGGVLMPEFSIFRSKSWTLDGDSFEQFVPWTG